MADAKHNSTNAAAGVSQSPCNDLRRLQAAVYDMDCLANGGFSEITAIARLALLALETPDGYRHPEIIAQALNAILGKAENIESCINYEAEEVGCNYQDPNTERRYAAERAAREKACHACYRSPSHDHQSPGHH